MNSDNCHLCGGELFFDPVVELNGMPKAAQYYPVVEEFEDDNGITLKIYQCKECGLVQLNIDPVDYFKEVITAANLSEKARLSRLEQIKEFVSNHDLKGKKVLEIGSGKGVMLDVMAEAGMQATGIEDSVKSVEAGSALGRDMICGYFGDIEFVDRTPFDGFISLNYLEHLPNPGLIIKKMYDITTERAVGFVTVPNLEYLLKSKCFYEFVADHVSYFTQKTLTYAFQRNGFDILECRIINNDNDILIIVKKIEQLNISDQYREVEELINHIQRIANDYDKQNKKIAVWGAGHRTLALLALADLDGIVFVVDSAEFKQGRYTPVLHKKIVSPEYLASSGVDLIIIMLPGIYPEEVLKVIENMDIDIEVAILRDNNIEFM